MLCKDSRLAVIGAMIGAMFISAVAVAADDGETQDVKAKAISLQVPKSWKPVAVKSQFRVAQFEIPATDEKAEPAELVVYHFGGPTGGVKANVSRWIGQFQEDGRKVVLRQGDSRQGKYVLADVSGTWNKPDGPPFAQKTIETPGSRVIGVILIVPQDESKDYYFFKLAGSDELVQSQAAALRKAFGGDAASEKPFKLDDAES